MTSGHRRSVTRSYVWGLIFAVVILAFALMLLAWAGIALATGGAPVSSPGISFGAAPVAVLLCLALLVWVLWAQSLVLLRGMRMAPWGHLLLVSLGSYLVWSLVGILTGLSIAETWLSPYALALALSWAFASLLCWALLMRRVYTDRPAPRWPWEDRDSLGPDWAHTDDNPWKQPDDESGPREGQN